MSFIKKILGKTAKREVEPVHGGPVDQTQEEKDVTRSRMEDEMVGQRARREEAATLKATNSASESD